jgi:hypothetical protein
MTVIYFYRIGSRTLETRDPGKINDSNDFNSLMDFWQFVELESELEPSALRRKP